MFDDIRMFARYAWGLKSFFGHTLSPEQCHIMLTRQLESRDESFLRILKRGVYANPKSPYRKILIHEGIEFTDVLGLVRQHGVEEALTKLYEAGVFVTIDEFKGRKPLERPGGLHFDVNPHDFDNPFLTKHYEAKSSGSRGTGTRVIIDLDLLTHEAAYFHYFLTAFDLYSRPIGTWRELPPVTAGMKLVLRYAKLGKTLERWFAQSKFSLSSESQKFFLFTIYTIYLSRVLGKPIPKPEYVSLDEATKVASWLAKKKKEGKPPILDTNVSSGVRVCVAAKTLGLDISDTFFRFGGEPFTMSKSKLVSETGCRAVCHYSLSEIGTVGVACASPENLDDVHMLTDKVAVIQRPKSLGNGELSVGALVFTTILPSCPKLMLNVESGDYGLFEKRFCGCPFGELGFHNHLSEIRSYEKLTSDGVTFLGTELLKLVDEILPKSFGGSPTDYQFVEEEVEGITKVNLVVSPRVGQIREDRVLAKVFKVLQSYPGGEVMVAKWRQGDTLRVTRCEPHTTLSSKILPLHIVKKLKPNN